MWLSRLRTQLSIHEDAGSIPGLVVAVSCGVGRRHSLRPALQALWHKPAAVAPIRPLAWELPYAEGAVLNKNKTNKKQTKKPQNNKTSSKSTNGDWNKQWVEKEATFCWTSDCLYAVSV